MKSGYARRILFFSNCGVFQIICSEGALRTIKKMSTMVLHSVAYVCGVAAVVCSVPLSRPNRIMIYVFYLCKRWQLVIDFTEYEYSSASYYEKGM